MLREVYFSVGMTGTLLVGGLLILTAMSWFVAVAGTVVRPMRRGQRVAILSLLAIVPPSALVILYRFITSSVEFPRPSSDS